MPRLPLPVSVNTTPAILALAEAVGGTYANKAKMMGCSLGGLWKLTKDGPGHRLITIDTLSFYAQKCAEQGGPAMAFTVTPNGDLFWEIRKSGVSKTGYAKGIKNTDHKAEEDDEHDDHDFGGGSSPGSHPSPRSVGAQWEAPDDGNPFGG